MRISLLCFCLMGWIPNAYTKSNPKDSCQCNRDFDFVVDYLENHYSGFRDNVTSNNRSAYEDLKKQLSQKSREQQTSIECHWVLKQFLNFFKDNHLQIWLENSTTKVSSVNEKSEAEVLKFKSSPLFLNRERIAFDSAMIWKAIEQSPDSLVGVYENDVYQIAVLQNRTSERNYYGVITRSKTPLWEKGQVKLEVKTISKGVYQTLLYLRNFTSDVRIIETENPVVAMMSDLRKIYPFKTDVSKVTYSNAPRGKWFQFKELNDSTSYLHIKTFNGALKSKFDSAYKRVLPIILKYPHLIIDIRDNGGGSDRCWSELQKYWYTGPIAEDAMEIYCSTETIKRYEEWVTEMRANRKGWGSGIIKYYKVKIRKMKKAKPGSFLPLKDIIPWYARPFFKFDSLRQNKIYPMPKKIILVYNRNSGSAAEDLILSAMKSNKVLTFGDNSGGYLTFGDVRTVKTPSGFGLQCSTTRIPARFQYEKTGIPPRVRANDQQDWIEQTNQLWKLMK